MSATPDLTQPDWILFRIVELYARERMHVTADLDRTLRAFANFKLAVMEEGFDEWVEIHDGFDWVAYAHKHRLVVT